MQKDQSNLNVDLTRVYCAGNKPTRFLCYNSICKHSAVLCRDQTCNCFQEKHPTCRFIQTGSLVSKITAKKTQPSEETSRAMQALDKIYNDAIQMLSLKRDQFQIWKQSYGLNANEVKLLDAIVNNSDQLNGRLVSQVLKTLDSQANLSGFTFKWVQNMWQPQKQRLQRIIARLERVTLASFGINKIVQWDLVNKSTSVTITDRSAVQTVSASSTQRITFLTPSLQDVTSELKWAIRLSNKAEWVALGICLFNKIKGMNYMFQGYEIIGHGHYIVSSNRYSWSHSVSEQNHQPKGIQYGVGDTINVRYDPQNKKIQFLKAGTQEKLTLTNISEPPEGDYYVPCVNFTGQGETLTIVQADPEIDWEWTK